MCGSIVNCQGNGVYMFTIAIVYAIAAAALAAAGLLISATVEG